MLVLGMVAMSRLEFDVAQLLQVTADGGLVKRDRKFLMEPLRQIDQLPAHHPVDGRDRAALDNVDQGLALHIAQPRTRARRLAIQQSIRSTGIEPDHPVPHNLKPDPPIRGAALRLPPS